MQFEWNGRPYVLEFERQYREGFKTRYPYTTARVLEIINPQETKVVREYSVGCHFKDQFTYEDGRRAALRMALFDDPRAKKNPMALDKGLKTAAWDAYFKRWQDGKKRISKWGREVK